MSGKSMDFISPTGKPIMVALIEGGHTISIGTTPTPVPAKFHAEALALGCIPAVMADAYKSDQETVAKNISMDRPQIIMAAMQRLVDMAAVDAAQTERMFDTHGRPKTNFLSKELGFTVTATERDVVWARFVEEKTKE